MSYLISTKGGEITLGERDTVASALQNGTMILRTPKGSVPQYRDFGISFDMVDRPLPAAKVLLYRAIKEALEQYEPRLKVVGVTFEMDEEDPGHLIPIVEVEVSEES